MRTLIRLGAAGAMVGGGLRIAAAFIPFMPDSGALELLYGCIDIALLFGLIGLYLSIADRIGKWGLACFAIALVALASIIGPDAAAFGINWYWAGATLLMSAMAALSINLLRHRLFRASSACWLGSTLLGIIAATGNGAALATSGVAFGCGFILAGYQMWQADAEAISRPDQQAAAA